MIRVHPSVTDRVFIIYLDMLELIYWYSAVIIIDLTVISFTEIINEIVTNTVIATFTVYSFKHKIKHLDTINYSFNGKSFGKGDS